jgi:hypothetical protein
MESPVPEYRASDWLSDDVSHKPGLRTSLFTALASLRVGHADGLEKEPAVTGELVGSCTCC